MKLFAVQVRTRFPKRLDRQSSLNPGLSQILENVFVQEHVTGAYKMIDSGFSLRSVMKTQNDALKQCKGR